MMVYDGPTLRIRRSDGSDKPCIRLPSSSYPPIEKELEWSRFSGDGGGNASGRWRPTSFCTLRSGQNDGPLRTTANRRNGSPV